MQRINQAAALNSVNLIATCLLATRQHSLTRQELTTQLEFYRNLQHYAPYHSGVTLPEGFQRAEFLQSKGAVDFICDRRELRKTIASTLAMLQRQPADAVS